MPDTTTEMTIPQRILQPGQTCVVHAINVTTGETTEVYRTDDILLEAPNWSDQDTMIVNGNGVLWRLSIGSGELEQIRIDGLPDLNNDHVLSPDPDTIFVSGYDWHIHKATISTGQSAPVTVDDPQRPMYHFLHGVSPDGTELAFVGIEPGPDGPWGPANIYTIPVEGGQIRQLTTGSRPADGSEYSPDSEWIYFNTEAFNDTPGHAQIARMRTDGSELTQLTFDERVNWFPHVSPDGKHICYLAFPSGTTGHPADLGVELRLVPASDWSVPTTVASLFGGQGTINVNSWKPDSTAFAYVSYPVATSGTGER